MSQQRVRPVTKGENDDDMVGDKCDGVTGKIFQCGENFHRTPIAETGQIA